MGWGEVKLEGIRVYSVPKRFERFLMMVRFLLVEFTYKNG